MAEREVIDGRPRSKTRRWPWAIAACLGALTIVFLCMPSADAIDPRLVGKWRAPDPYVGTGDHLFVFEPSGRSAEQIRIAGGAAALNQDVWRMWSVRGDILTLQEYRPQSLVGLYISVRKMVATLIGAPPAPRPTDTFQILKVSDEVLELKYTGTRRWPAPTYTLQRIDDAPEQSDELPR